MHTSLVRFAIVSVLMALVGGLSACSPADTQSNSQNDRIDVVSSLAVWGDVAERIGGDAVNVTSIIDSPDKDPHEYEATSRDQLTLSKAQVVIENGGGFDDFVTRMLDSSSPDDVNLLSVADITKVGQDDEERNEHFWYSHTATKEVAAEVKAELTRLMPDKADMFATNFSDFDKEMDAMIARTSDLSDRHSGAPIGITEPLAYYLEQAIGLENRTDSRLSEAMEEGDDVSPGLMLATLKLYESSAVDALVYKEQRVGAQNEQILDAAESNGIPVVYVQEAFQPGDDYVTWMNGILDDFETALEA